MRTNEPEMNITNQINAGLNDVRKTLIALSEREPDSGTVCTEMARARYELNLIYDHDNRTYPGHPLSTVV